ncbi:unnamed protein product [Cladocopium goreaui]|uniref:Tyr recombinase domain-containing protein n=1 Tax=Cladocopium goreaui TaxID=2562237 RepID=A0A9P1GG63_9DINO|nr:unnamed protein product [Cladocopium goreaui]
MSRLGDGPTGASALKLRWGKYSIAYQRRLLEGGRSLREFFDRKELDWNLVQRGKARVVDEILEQFVREKHADDRRSSLRVAKHGILWVQVIRPRLRHSLPGELLALRAADATLPNSLAVGCSFAVIRLVRPKNARQMGRLQFTELRHPDAVNWLCWLKMRAPQEHAVRWPGTAAKFRHMFKTVCSAMKIRELRLSPASLRAGGATLLVDQGMEINRVRLLGRWAHLRSLEHYVQIARAEQIALSIPSVVARQLKSFLCRFSFLLVLPKFLAAQVALEHLVHAPVCKSKDPNMPSQSLEHGEEIERQFKKAVVAGGPLKGARFLDVGWEDLKKAARSYRIRCLDLWVPGCTVDTIAEIRKERRLREIRKFRTLDGGRSINVGSVVDGVPFETWSWAEEAKTLAENPDHQRQEQVAKPSKGGGKGKGKDGKDGKGKSKDGKGKRKDGEGKGKGGKDRGKESAEWSEPAPKGKKGYGYKGGEAHGSSYKGWAQWPWQEPWAYMDNYWDYGSPYDYSDYGDYGYQKGKSHGSRKGKEMWW